tara:strand:- start:397 stop:1110 length:714 start_codon:yes stop_codon:yes gene_type:complete
MIRIIKKIFQKLDSISQKKNILFIKKKLGNEIETLIDIGANVGETILEFNRNFKIKKIYSIEPNFEAYNEIKKQKNKNVEVFNFAASDIEEQDKLKIGYLSSMSTINEINNDSIYTKVKSFIIWILTRKFAIYKNETIIEKKRLDKFIDKQDIDVVDILKIDTEGHEFNVIKGLGDHITKVKLILFEYHDDDSIVKNYSIDDIDNHFASNNFIQKSKIKMKFRNIYEYIFINKKYLS